VDECYIAGEKKKKKRKGGGDIQEKREYTQLFIYLCIGYGRRKILLIEKTQ
jgi:hypothetical protein